MQRFLILAGLVFVAALPASFGCSVSEEAGPNAQVRFSIPDTGYIASQELLIEGSDREKSWEINGNDFGPVSFDSALWTEPFNTASSGSLDVSFEITSAHQEEIANGTFQLPLREDWEWSISFRADSASADPLVGCLGCSGFHTFEIDTTAASPSSRSGQDSIYVVWGGNSLGNPVDY